MGTCFRPPKIQTLIALILFLVFIVPETLPQIPEQGQSDAGKRIEAGKKLSNEGEHKEAIIQLLEGLNMAKTRHEASEACLYLALCYYALGERANCARYLKNFFEAQPERDIEALYFPAAFVGLFYQAKTEAAKQADLKPEEKAEEKKAEPEKKTEIKAEETKAEPEKKEEPEKNKEEGKPPAGIGKGAQPSPIKKKSKFPWLAAGAAIVGGGILAVVLLHKKESAGPSGLQVGNIVITSTPTGAKVYLDGSDTGQATDCTLTDISAGQHALKLEREDYGTWEGQVMVKAGQTANVNATLAGYAYEFVTKWGTQGAADGQFNEPGLMAMDAAGDIYVADSGNNRVQKFTSNGTFLAKWRVWGTDPVELTHAVGVAVDGSGHVYMTEYHNIQKFDANGDFLIGWGGYPEWYSPRGVAIDSSGYVYVAMGGYHRIEKYTSGGVFVGRWGGVQGSGDGEFQGPEGMARDGSGSFYVTDNGNHRIQKLTSNGAFVTKWGSQGAQDGQFRNPIGIAVDKSGSVYVADEGNNRVQKFTPSGTFMTKWGITGSGDGQFISPRGVAVDDSGYVYVSDSRNHRIQKFRMTSETQKAASVTYTELRSDPWSPRLPEMRPWPNPISLTRTKILSRDMPPAPHSPRGEKQIKR